MAENDYTHDNLTLTGRHVPDPDAQALAGAYDSRDPKTGTYEIGVEIEGAFIPIFTERAGFIFSRIERARAASERTRAAQPQPQTTTAAPATTTTTAPAETPPPEQAPPQTPPAEQAPPAEQTAPPEQAPQQ